MVYEQTFNTAACDGHVVGPAHKGQFNQHVFAAQFALSMLGYETGKPDGFYGTLTQHAILAYQEDNCQDKTGATGALSTNSYATLIQEGCAKLRNAAYAFDPCDTVVGGYPNNHALTENIQVMCKCMGINPGPLDGQYGPKTQKALHRLQSTLGLDQSDALTGEDYLALVNTFEAHLQNPPVIKPAIAPPPSKHQDINKSERTTWNYVSGGLD